jgi:predicted PurR-regulated permease PerM
MKLENSIPWRVDLGVFLVLLVFCLLTYLLGEAVTPFVIAMLFAYILNPAVDYLERRKVPRGVAIGIFAALFFAAIAGAFVGIVMVLKYEIPQLLANLPGYIETVKTDYLPFVQRVLGVTLDLDRMVADLKERLGHLSAENYASAAGYAFTIVSGTVNVLFALVGVFLVPVLMIYLLFDYKKMKAGALDIMPRGYREVIIARLREVEGVLRDFVKGQLMVAFIMGILYSIGLAIVGVDMPILVGMLSGFGNLVPYLGTTIGLGISVILVLLKYHDLMHPGFVILVFILVQTAEAYVITPKVVGNKLGLHPVVIILSLLVFGKLLGFAGVILAVPIAAVLKVFIKSFVVSYMNSSLYAEKGARTKKAEK